MRTWQPVVCILLAMLCAFPLVSSALPTVIHAAPSELNERLRHIEERTITLTELTVFPESCQKELRHVIRKHIPPASEEAPPFLAIAIGKNAAEGIECSLIKANKIDPALGRQLNRNLETSLKNGVAIEQAITELLSTLSINLPPLPVSTPPEDPLLNIPVEAPKTVRLAPPHITAIPVFDSAPVALARVKIPAEPLRTPANSRFLIAALIAVIVVLIACVCLLLLLIKRQRHEKIVSLALDDDELDEDELLEKCGFGGCDFEKMATEQTYERKYREQLYKAGLRLSLLGILTEVAEERYPDLWNGLRKKLSLGRTLLAKEIEARNMEVLSDRDKRPLRERVINVCRALNLASNGCTLLFEAYEYELEHHFKVYNVLRTFYAEAKGYRVQASSLPDDKKKALLEALRQYDLISADVRSERVASWLQTYLDLSILKEQIEDIGKPPRSKQLPPPIPSIITDHASNHKIVELPENNLSQSSMGDMGSLPTLVPNGIPRGNM